MLIIVFVVIEALTLGLTTIWFAIGALVSFLFAWMGFSWAVQLFVFFGLSIVLLCFTGPIARKYLKIGATKTNIYALIGEVGCVVKRIEPFKPGQVDVNGQIWAAKALDNMEIQVDENVIIMNIEGVKLIVQRRDG
ncbi:MAG: NfeD family protein [Clostridia bacterium]|nr:NfeD family protein [Clostridia bacterium]MDD4048007.1 NfeD family protein [Clostridia bacterium]